MMRIGGAPTAWITALLLCLGAGCVPSESPEVRVAGSGSTAGGGDSHDVRGAEQDVRDRLRARIEPEGHGPRGWGGTGG